MKIVRLFLVAGIALGLAACNNDVPEVQDNENVLTIKVVPGGNLNGVRAQGNPSAQLTAESAVKTLEAWVFSGDNLEKYVSETISADSEIKIPKLTVGPKKVVVVANGNVGSQPNLTALLAVTKELSQNLDNGLIMTTEPKEVTLTPCEQANCNTATVTVTRVNARVAVVNVTSSFEADAAYDEFKLEEISMFNVRKNTKLFGTPLYSGNEYLYGVQYPITPENNNSYVGCPNYTGTANGAVDATLKDTYAEAISIKNGTALFTANENVYYYVNENDATEKQETFLVLKGKLYKNGTQYTLPGVYTNPLDGYTYYKVYVNAKKDNYTYDGPVGYEADGKIVRNTQYNISINLTKAGNPTPDQPEESCLDVTVTVEPWVVVNQSVQW